MDKKVNIFWFRRDLRYHDNHGLFEALRQDLPVVPLFIFDREILNDLQDKYDKRVNFIYHKLHQINGEFRKYNSSLLVKKGNPSDVFREILKDYQVENVFTNRDYEPYAIERDKKTESVLAHHGVNLLHFKDQVIFEKDEVVKADGSAYSVFTPYSKAWMQNFSTAFLDSYPSEEWLGNLQKEIYDFPILEKIGFQPSNFDYPSENPDKDVIKQYHITRNNPWQNGTTRMGIHLRFGTVSVREMIRLGYELNRVWLNELIWREFYMMILFHHPYVVKLEFKPKYRLIPWRNSESDFQRWKDGLTGFPIVDAGMRELKQTDYMHNRVRMITASFLTKHLLLDWRWGEAWFAEKLLDYELASNNGNWQWAAGSGCDAAPYFRVFNPETQAKKFDPEGKYIQRWLPEYGSPAYPKPMVDHKEARERALKTYKHALNSIE